MNSLPLHYVNHGRRSKVKAVREAMNKEKGIQINNQTMKAKEKDEYLSSMKMA